MNVAQITGEEIRPADLLTSRAQLRQPQRAPDLKTEVVASFELAALLADDPAAALRRLLEMARRLCNAGSAGLSVLRFAGAGRTTVHWEAVCGELAPHEGTSAPRDLSPCGLCLDAGETVLVTRPERLFAQLQQTRPWIVEDLIVPLFDSAEQPVGTFWVAHHDSGLQFSSGDARVLEQLAVHVVLALKLRDRAREHRYALAVLESHQRAQRKLLAHDLTEERSLRERAEASESSVRQTLAFKEAVIHEVNHRVKNTLQVAATLLAMHARATSSEQVRLALHESQDRLQVLAKIHELLCHSADGAQAVLMPTLLHAMGSALRQSFADAATRVRLQIASDQIVLSPDDAIAMALLANEVLTNAYKHAFPNAAAGEINVSLRRAPDNALVLQITDNGVGVPARGDGKGLGLKLIHTFAAQLQGTLTIATPVDASGTVVTLTSYRNAKRSKARRANPLRIRLTAGRGATGRIPS